MKMPLKLRLKATLHSFAVASLAAMLATSPIARAQVPVEDSQDIFNDEDELNEPPGTFNPAPPPPPPPGGFQPQGNPGNGSSDFGGNSGGFGNNNTGNSGHFPTPQKGPTAAIRNSGAAKAPPIPVAKKPDAKKPSMADASIEDITNENYPDLIESFDYPNAEITDVIKAMSQLTGKNFIVDPSVHGKITIIAPSQITVAEAWKAFLAALAVNQMTVVPYGKFMKVESARNAMHDSIDTYSGKYYPDSDILITKIVHLKHISAEEVNKRLRILPSRDGELTPYEPTNSLIITDHGSNIERIMKIINELDRPGFEEQLAVIIVRYAKAKDIADLVNQIINKSPTKAGAGGGFPGQPAFGAGIPRFGATHAPGSGSPEEMSLVAPDDRTNAIIVVGNTAGIQKVRELVKKLDYKLDPAEAGGVFVYYCRYGEAEKIAQTLSGVTQQGGAAGQPGAGGFPAQGGFRPFAPTPLNSQSIFGGDVKIVPDKNTNSLVITASQIDYHTVLDILAKLDIPKDQVFVEAIIMEMVSDRRRDWAPNYLSFSGDPNGIGRSGFLTSGVGSILDPTKDSGVVLGFGSSSTVTLNLGGTQVVVPNLLAFINLIQQNTETNILSTPRILAQDNEPAEIEVGDKIATGQTTASVGNSTTASNTFEDVSIKLKVTPFIRPDSEVVRLNVEQSVKQPSNVKSAAANLAATTVNVSNRSVKTNIAIHNGDTAVLGGLVHDEDDVDEIKVPILGDIPVLGWLFKSKKHDTKKSNLVVFLTPKIIRNIDDSHSVLQHITNDRIDWLKKNFDGRDPYGKRIDELPRAANGDARIEDDAPLAPSRRGSGAPPPEPDSAPIRGSTDGSTNGSTNGSLKK